MGMYFNTPATLKLMQTLNTRYGTTAQGLAAKRTNDLNYLLTLHIHYKNYGIHSELALEILEILIYLIG